MTQEQLQELDVGDVVQHASDGHTYVVIANFGDRVTAVNVADITNAREWTLLLKAEHERPPVYATHHIDGDPANVLTVDIRDNRNRPRE